MIVLHALPPNYDQIVEAFPAVKDSKTVVFTYCGAIYNPYRGHIDEALGLHEALHSLQQDAMGPGEEGAKAWWDKYIESPAFRFDQEARAYGVQYRRICELNRDRNKRAWYLHRFAQDLSSPQYGNVATLAQAKHFIIDYSTLPIDV